MKKVRFLESCYMFTTKNSYDVNSITYIEEDQAIKLYNRGVVDFLEDEEYLDEEELANDKQELKLKDKTVAELREIADKNEVAHSGLRKAELIAALEEVL